MFSYEGLSGVIKTALTRITAVKHPLWSPEAEELLIMIAAHESHMGKYLRQLGGGPARGVFQIEPATLLDNYRNFIDIRPKLAAQIEAVSGCGVLNLDQLQFNPIYGAIHARLKLYRSPGAIPTDTALMAEYAKQYYNSADGAATPEDYLNAYYEARRL